MKTALRVVVVGLLLAGAFVWKSRTGAKPGERCERGSDCARMFSGACVLTGESGYCSRECSSQRDCEAGWSCTDARTHSGRMTKTRTVCVRL